ncbi:MAG: hypothetical protein M3332_13805 [Actinomycetota bacterium]|nr:hypothetical protein [Actinomycetota bacterium]
MKPVEPDAGFIHLLAGFDQLPTPTGRHQPDEPYTSRQATYGLRRLNAKD